MGCQIAPNICQLNSAWLKPGTGIPISGRPSPAIEHAMLTPSPVFAYWMRGSIVALILHPADMEAWCQDSGAGSSASRFRATRVEHHSKAPPRLADEVNTQ